MSDWGKPLPRPEGSPPGHSINTAVLSPAGQQEIPAMTTVQLSCFPNREVVVTAPASLTKADLRAYCDALSVWLNRQGE